MNKENFVHNNMVPFFRGSLKQNMTDTANSNTLERYTGVGNTFRPKKKEVSSFFDVSTNMTNPYGSRAYTSNPGIMNRYIPSQKRTGERPFEQINVGPGLAAGYTATPEGGFTQEKAREYLLPKNVEKYPDYYYPKSFKTMHTEAVRRLLACIKDMHV